jgi:hypothetical protein
MLHEWLYYLKLYKHAPKNPLREVGAKADSPHVGCGKCPPMPPSRKGAFSPSVIHVKVHPPSFPPRMHPDTPEPLIAMDGSPLRKGGKKARKSRGRGLRTTTGCRTCRQRHMKCDEKQPKCGPCERSARECVFKPVSVTVSLEVGASPVIPFDVLFHVNPVAGGISQPQHSML